MAEAWERGATQRALGAAIPSLWVSMGPVTSNITNKQNIFSSTKPGPADLYKSGHGLCGVMVCVV